MSINKNISFIQFIRHFGYKGFNNTTKDVFEYKINFSSEKNISTSVPITFFCLSNNSDFFKIHKEIWNRNNSNIFIVVDDNSTSIYNGKIKPQKDKPSHAKIASFNYGLKHQSSDFPEILRKEKMDGGYFFDFIIKKRKKNREQEVDKDLLLNLIALRQDLLQISDDSDTIDLLILRCLFLKYLEDRGIYETNYLVNILETGKTKNLLAAFEEISKINGDVFKYDSLAHASIHSDYLSLLALFFKTDYRSKQGRLFPYKFNFIPIQLISNVYEAFLSNAKKQGKGIYYTPKFVVDFMLSQTLIPELKTNKHLSIFDPACGSGAYLVEGFKAIVKSRKAEKDFEVKKDILKNHVFGVDNDAKALQIATFSLYLALLENLDPKFIKHQIKHQTPILPSLIGENLICGNSLTDNDIFKDKTFDCILANPPWGSVPTDDNPENQKEREAIGGKGEIGTIPEYENVSDYQRSQAFLLRVKKWAHERTKLALIVNNSVFLNQQAEDFRKDFLDKYRLTSFYELSKLNKILFRKRSIGKINGKRVEAGATEPCAILIFDNQDNQDNITRYISPELDTFSEAFLLIHYSDYDIKEVQQSDLSEEQMLWRIFVNGNWDDYQFIRSKIAEGSKRKSIVCLSGFQPKKNMKQIGKPSHRKIVKSGDFSNFFIKNELGTFNWNQDKHRERKQQAILFEGNRIILAVRPREVDNYKLRAAYLIQNEVFSDDILCVRVIGNQIVTNENIKYVLGILNSSFAGYISFKVAVQWGKGGLKRAKFRTNDIESIPLPNLPEGHPKIIELNKFVEQIETEKKNPFSNKVERLEQQIDNLVFELYDLTEFEKAVIREFYDVRVHRKADKLNKVNKIDLNAYFYKFREVFELALEDLYTIEAHYKISKNLGAFMVFQIKEKALADKNLKESRLTEDEVFHAIKKSQLEDAFYSNRLNEQKTKVYESERFFMIKSHFFKDWTARQAIKDANEEIKTFLQETTIG